MRHPARRLIGQLLMLLLLMTPVIGQALPCPMPPAHAAPDQSAQADGDQPCHDSAGHHTDTTSAADTGPGAQAHAGMALADCLSVLAPPARTDLQATAGASVTPDISGPPALPAATLIAHAAGLSAPPPPSHPAPPASRLWADSQRLLL